MVHFQEIFVYQEEVCHHWATNYTNIIMQKIGSIIKGKQLEDLLQLSLDPSSANALLSPVFLKNSSDNKWNGKPSVTSGH